MRIIPDEGSPPGHYMIIFEKKDVDSEGFVRVRALYKGLSRYLENDTKKDLRNMYRILSRLNIDEIQKDVKKGKESEQQYDNLDAYLLLDERKKERIIVQLTAVIHDFLEPYRSQKTNFIKERN